MPDLPTGYDELHQARMREPFAPFTIVMQDGRRFEITQRLQMGFNEFTIIVNEGVTIHRLRMKELVGVEAGAKRWQMRDEFYRQISSLALHRPFSPFSIIVKGRKFEIEDRNQLAMNQSTLVVVPRDAAYEVFSVADIERVDAHGRVN